MEIKKRCVKGTVDIVIFGGMYLLNNPDVAWCWKEAEKTRRTYKESISLLSSTVVEVFGFEPVVICGPKRVERFDSVLCINGSRRIYIARPQVGKSTTESFLPSNLEIREEKW